MHAGVLLVAAGEAAVLEGGLAETVVLVVVDGAVELEPDVFDGDGCCEPQAAAPRQDIAAIVTSRNMKVLSMAHFAGDAVIVAVQRGAITRLPAIDRRGTGITCRPAIRVIDVRTRRRCR
jgi:hypothetical protein